MTQPTTSELLKYADLQMASEAFLTVKDDPNNTPLTGQDLIKALVRGNDHASKFTAPQAEEFIKHWEVVAQQPNTGTGFSATLFRCRLDDPATGAREDELVISFRSTEFIDD